MRGKHGTAGICIPRSAAHASDMVLRNTGDHVPPALPTCRCSFHCLFHDPRGAAALSTGRCSSHAPLLCCSSHSRCAFHVPLLFPRAAALSMRCCSFRAPLLILSCRRCAFTAFRCCSTSHVARRCSFRSLSPPPFSSRALASRSLGPLSGTLAVLASGGQGARLDFA